MPGPADEFDDEDAAIDGDDAGQAEDETPENDEEDEDEAPAADEPDDFVFEEEEEAETPPESSVIRDLRKRLREAQAARTPEAPKPVEVGPKPVLADLDYDEDKFEAELLAWNERKAQAEAQAKAANSDAEAHRAAFSEDLANYEREKAALKVRDYDSASELVEAAFSPIQQAIVIQAAQSPAKLVYALGKHPARLEALAAITNPVKLAAAVAKLEGSMKVTTRERKPAAADEPVRGSASIAKERDHALEKLERRAERDPSFDRGEILRYKQRKEAERGKPKVRR